MIFPSTSPHQVNNEEEPFIVPLAIPYLAGPSTLATLLLIMNNEPQRWPEWLIALGAAWALAGVILLSAPFLAKILRNRGLIAVERLMGMVLVAIAVQMLMDGVSKYISTIS